MDNFYRSHIIGILIWLLIVLICMLSYLIYAEWKEEPTIKISHAMIIKWQENDKKRDEKIIEICGNIQNTLDEGLIITIE